MFRFIIAFLIAPLAIPVIEAPPWELYRYYDLWWIFLSTVIAYAGTFLFGIPIYFFLRARNWTGFWVAPIAGFIVAALTWWLVGFFAALSSGHDLFDIHAHLDWLRFALWPYGPIGALVATLVWLMARVERTGSDVTRG